jgi:hypothetical protein
MTQIFDRRIDHPSAWTSSRIGGKEGLMHRMGPEHLDAVGELLARTRHIAPDAITREDFDHPAINALMLGVREEIMHGKAAIILSGLDMSRTSLEDFCRIYFGLGTHLGDAAIQSAKMDRIGFVQKEEHNPDGRGYQLDIELRSHCDFHEILSLASFRKAARGGESGAVSALAIHNAMLEEAPEHLAELYRGFYHGYADPSSLTKEKVPIFCNVDGVVSCFYHALFMLNAARQMGVELPPELRAAMTRLGETAQRPDIRADFMLEPGEMLFWHNFVVLHSRQAFTNEGEHKRLLLRLWLHVRDGGRPMHPEFAGRARLMDQIHASGATALNYSQLGLSTSVEKSLEAVAGE